MLSLTLGESEADFLAVRLVFLIDVLQKGLEVFRRFLGFISHVVILVTIYGFQVFIIPYTQLRSQTGCDERG